MDEKVARELIAATLASGIIAAQGVPCTAERAIEIMQQVLDARYPQKEDDLAAKAARQTAIEGNLKRFRRPI